MNHDNTCSRARGDSSAPVILLIVATGLWAGCGEDGPAEPAAPEVPRPTTVQVSPATVELAALGDAVRLAATVLDQNGQTMAGTSVSWSSGDASVATVDGSGLVTSVGDGEAAITAVSGEATGSAAVTVAQRVAQVRVSPDSVTLVALGDTVRLSAEALDANGHAVANAEFAWSSGDASVATVDGSGLVTSAEIGAVVITATSSGVSGRAALTVADPEPTNVAVIPDTVALTALGETAQLAAEVSDQLGRLMASVLLSWSSADTTVAAVDSAGLVTAAGSGATTVISAQAGDAWGTALVTVVQATGSVVVSPAADTVAPGDTVRLSAQVLDANGHPVEGAEFLWSSSNGTIAAVDGSGLVTGNGEGSATITATAGDARGASAITVENPDRAALLALYDATDGPIWRDNTNWLTDAPLGEWYGVETDESGRVVSVELDSNDLSGPIPPELGNLANLEGLDLFGNALSGPIPPELGNLASLESLWLDFNDLTGTIPPELGNLANLESLWLGENNLTGTIPPELGNLANLVELYLYATDLSGPIPPELGDLAYLEYLDLYATDLSGPIPPELGDLANLEILALDSTDLSGPIPPELGDLASLESLWLGENNLTGTIPPELGNLANLVELYLYATDLSGPIPPELGDLAYLEHLDLSSNHLSGPIPPELGDLASLESLWLGENNLTGTIPPELGNLANLVELYLYATDLSGPIPPELGDLANLEHLDLSSNHLLSGPIPPELGDLANLVLLQLNSNDLSGPIPPELGDLAKLVELHLDFNDLSGAIPQSFLQLDRLVTFFFGGQDVCLPGSSAFLAWFEGIRNRETGAELFCNATDMVALESLLRSDGWLGNLDIHELLLPRDERTELDRQARPPSIRASSAR